MTSFTTAMQMMHSSIHHFYMMIPLSLISLIALISAYLSDISVWIKEHHLQLNLAKTVHNITVQLGSTTLTPTRTARNLGVVCDIQLCFTTHIYTMAPSCRFTIYNIRKIRPFLSEFVAPLLLPVPR